MLDRVLGAVVGLGIWIVVLSAGVLILVFAALADLRRSTRRPLPKLNPRDGPSLRGPYSPRHAAAAQATSAKS